MFPCVPLQNGGVPVCLHWHNDTRLRSLMVKTSGSNSEPRCDSSQNGWLSERPQLHQR